MDRRQLDEIFDMFVTFDTMITNRGRNKFLVKSQTKKETKKKKNRDNE